mmetsp:Transcript_17369/g.34851  ORF Transcript_17369/g.34851 Transcript_17369/m.34851 type:complete len:378 (+) Transcript_17369:140-1273(+)
MTDSNLASHVGNCTGTAVKTKHCSRTMKLSTNASGLVLALIATSSGVAKAATTESTPPQPPSNCIGTSLIPAADRDTLHINGSICRDNLRLGINADGVYGVWDGDELVQKFATRVSKLTLSETKDGESVDITAYKKRDEAVWHLSCEGLSGQGETKLTVHDDNSNIVRLKQGHKTQDKLWLVHSDGRSKLDDSEGRLCQVVERHETHESGTNTDAYYKMIVFSRNNKLCMSASRSEGMREGDRIALATCSDEDEAELFVFDERGRIRPRRSPDLCVNVEEAVKGQELELADCRVASNNIWLHDRSSHDLRPRGGKQFCVNYGGGLLGATIALDDCNRQSAWDLVNPANYESPKETGEDQYQASRKFLRWRALIEQAM